MPKPKATLNWPAEKVEMVPLAKLVPYARNARTHSEDQIKQVMASMKEWGWTNPILVDEGNTIIAGHCRVLAAERLGITDAPCMTATGWSDAKKRAYIIADNKLAMNAGWDMGLLATEFAEIGEAGFDLSLTGFSDDELSALRFDGNTGLTDPDSVPEAPETPVSVLGDTWLLGNHRLRCGDSTSADDVAQLLGNVKPHLMVTDPPYGVEYDPAKARAVSVMSAKGMVQNDDRADWREAWALFPGAIAYVWHADLRAREVVESLEVCGFAMRAQIIWDKMRPIMSRGHYHFQHEPCWYAVRKNATAEWNGDRKQSTVWAIEHRKSETGHSTQKPVECMRRPIVNNSSPGQAVYEPFSGSGTTIIAGEMEGRPIFAMELHPPYVDVAIKRWQDFTGQEATLEATGETFNSKSSFSLEKENADTAAATAA